MTAHRSGSLTFAEARSHAPDLRRRQHRDDARTLRRRATLRAHWRIMTDVARTPDEFGVLLRGLLAGADIALGDVNGVAIGSVVPRVTAPLAEACRAAGSPRDARRDHRRALAAADHARTSTSRSRSAPTASSTRSPRAGIRPRRDRRRPGHRDDLRLHHEGRRLPRRRDRARACARSAETLFRRTSKLPATELVAPARAIGTRTEECIRAGRDVRRRGVDRRHRAAHQGRVAERRACRS